MGAVGQFELEGRAEFVSNAGSEGRLAHRRSAAEPQLAATGPTPTCRLLVVGGVVAALRRCGALGQQGRCSCRRPSCHRVKGKPKELVLLARLLCLLLVLCLLCLLSQQQAHHLPHILWLIQQVHASQAAKPPGIRRLLCLGRRIKRCAIILALLTITAVCHATAAPRGGTTAAPTALACCYRLHRAARACPRTCRAAPAGQRRPPAARPISGRNSCRRATVWALTELLLLLDSRRLAHILLPLLPRLLRPCWVLRHRRRRSCRGPLATLPRCRLLCRGCAMCQLSFVGALHQPEGLLSLLPQLPSPPVEQFSCTPQNLEGLAPHQQLVAAVAAEEEGWCKAQTRMEREHKQAGKPGRDAVRLPQL